MKPPKKSLAQRLKEWFFGTEREDFDYDAWYDMSPEEAKEGKWRK